jgi:predicted transcriptional regulator
MRPDHRTLPLIAIPDRRLGAAGHDLPASGIFRTFMEMEIQFTPEQEAQLVQVAAKAGTAPERVVANVVERYLGEEARFLTAVEKGIAAADRGEFIEEDEMDARLEAMFKP